MDQHLQAVPPKKNLLKRIIVIIGIVLVILATLGFAVAKFFEPLFEQTG